MKRYIFISLILISLLFISATCDLSGPGISITPKCCIVSDVDTGDVIGCARTSDNADCNDKFSSLGNINFVSGTGCDDLSQCSGLTNCFGYSEEFETPYNIANGGRVCTPDNALLYYCDSGS